MVLIVNIIFNPLSFNDLKLVERNMFGYSTSVCKRQNSGELFLDGWINIRTSIWKYPKDHDNS